MKLGDVAHPERSRFGKPLDGVRVLALEQMQALPLATQLLARLGAEVVKVEQPGDGESGAAPTLPAMRDPDGRAVGYTYLRNNLGKTSVGLDLKHPRGSRADPAARAAASTSSPRTSSAGTMERLGLGYDASRRDTRSSSTFGLGLRASRRPSPYDAWPAYARSPRRWAASTNSSAGPGRRRPIGPDGRARRHGTRAVRRDRRPRRAASPRAAPVRAARRRRDVRRDDGDGRHRATNFWSLGISAPSAACAPGDRHRHSRPPTASS